MAKRQFSPAEPELELPLPPEYDGIKNLNREQTLRENARWAIEAAGEKHRTGNTPVECPNDTAYYMYLQAVDSPKEFFNRFAQIERAEDEAPTFRRDCQRSVEEITAMIEEIRYLNTMPDFLRPTGQ